MRSAIFLVALSCSLLGFLIGRSNPSATAQTTTNQPMEKKERPAVKLDDGRVVLFPELAKVVPLGKGNERVVDEKLLEQVWNYSHKLFSFSGTVPLEKGRQRINLERLTTSREYLFRAQLPTIQTGNFDRKELYLILANLDDMISISKELPFDRETQVAFQKGRLMFAYYFESFAEQRNRLVCTLMPNDTPHFRLYRLRCELELAEAEDRLTEKK